MDLLLRWWIENEQGIKDKYNDVLEVLEYRKTNKLWPYNTTGNTMPWNNG